MPPMATTEPPAAFSSGQAARQSRTWAKNFSAKPASQSASVCLKKSPRREAPALLIRISSRPKRCSTQLARRAGSSSSRRSATWISALRPSARTASATLAERVAGRARSAADRSRRAASSSAMALPMPRLAPVTSATLPCSSDAHAAIDCGSAASRQPTHVDGESGTRQSGDDQRGRGTAKATNACRRCASRRRRPCAAPGSRRPRIRPTTNRRRPARAPRMRRSLQARLSASIRSGRRELPHAAHVPGAGKCRVPRTALKRYAYRLSQRGNRLAKRREFA